MHYGAHGRLPVNIIAMNESIISLDSFKFHSYIIHDFVLIFDFNIDSDVRAQLVAQPFVFVSLLASLFFL